MIMNMDRFSSAEDAPDTRRCDCGHIAQDHEWEIGSEDTPCAACSCLRFVEPAEAPARADRDRDSRRYLSSWLGPRYSS